MTSFKQGQRSTTATKRILAERLTWDLSLDTTSCHICIEPSGSSSQTSSRKTMKIKTVTLKEMSKFGRDIAGTNLSVTPGSVIKCYVCNCNRWFSGICMRHPLLFVKENRPCTLFYEAKDTAPAEIMFVAESSIDGAGLGVFARQFLPAGIAFGPYAGVVKRKLKDENDWVYSWQKLNLDWSVYWVDAGDTWMSNWMRYVNCARFEEEQNMVPCFYCNEIYYYTYKPVPAGTELLTWYGEDYGKRLGLLTEYPDNGPSQRNVAPPKQTSDVVVTKL